MTVTGGQVTPGVYDSDQGLALKVFGGIAHLLGARAMAKRAHIIAPKPTPAAQLFR